MGSPSPALFFLLVLLTLGTLAFRKLGDPWAKMWEFEASNRYLLVLLGLIMACLLLAMLTIYGTAIVAPLFD